MNNNPEDIQRQIELLRAQLAALEAGRRGAKEAGDEVHGDQDARMGAFVGDQAQVYGPTVGLNLGQIIYNAVPEEEQREQLVRYLSRVSAKLGRLRLRCLSTLDDKGLQLPNVYVMLATTPLTIRIRTCSIDQ